MFLNMLRMLSYVFWRPSLIPLTQKTHISWLALSQAGKAAPNTAVGRAMQQALALLPTSEASFEQMFTNGVQDVLMVIYLANLTRSHLLLAERMRDQNAAAQQTQAV